MPRDDTFYTDAWAPVLDGVDLAEPIQDRIHKGAIAPGVPLLLGSNLDEGTEFMYVTPPLKCNASHAEFQVWADSFYGDSLGPQIECCITLADCSDLYLSARTLEAGKCFRGNLQQTTCLP